MALHFQDSYEKALGSASETLRPKSQGSNMTSHQQGKEAPLAKTGHDSAEQQKDSEDSGEVQSVLREPTPEPRQALRSMNLTTGVTKDCRVCILSF